MSHLQLIAVSTICITFSYSEVPDVPHAPDGPFESIVDARKKLNDPKYGPSKVDILTKVGERLLGDVQGVCVTKIDGVPNDAFVAASSRCIAGHQIVENIRILSRKDNASISEFSELVSKFENYGDRYPMVFRPDYAIELLTLNDSITLLFDAKTGMGRFSESKWHGGDTQVGSVVTFHKRIKDILLEIIKK